MRGEEKKEGEEKKREEREAEGMLSPTVIQSRTLLSLPAWQGSERKCQPPKTNMQYLHLRSQEKTARRKPYHKEIGNDLYQTGWEVSMCCGVVARVLGISRAHIGVIRQIGAFAQ